MSILAAFSHYVEGYRVMRERQRTERIISELPAEIRKDIGWPGTYLPRAPYGEGPHRP